MPEHAETQLFPSASAEPYTRASTDVNSAAGRAIPKATRRSRAPAIPVPGTAPARGSRGSRHCPRFVGSSDWESSAPEVNGARHLFPCQRVLRSTIGELTCLQGGRQATVLPRLVRPRSLIAERKRRLAADVMGLRPPLYVILTGSRLAPVGEDRQERARPRRADRSSCLVRLVASAPQHRFAPLRRR